MSYLHNIYVRLPCSNQNAKFEGVGGASTPTHGSVWFQMSGIEDSVEKVGVFQHVNTIAKTVKFDNKSSADPGSHQL